MTPRTFARITPSALAEPGKTTYREAPPIQTPPEGKTLVSDRKTEVPGGFGEMPRSGEWALNWEQVHYLCRDLAARVRPFEPDYVLAVANGGLVPAAVLRNLLGVESVGAAQLSHYAGRVRKTGPARLWGLLPSPIRNGHHKRVLVVDDVADTGDTLRVLEGEMEGHAREVAWACLVSKNPSGLPSPFSCALEVGREVWVAFPWEEP